MATTKELTAPKRRGRKPKAAKEEADRELGRLPGLLHKHDRETYKCLGRVVVIEPGADIVKIKKVKDK